jgi:predicted TIM-barrel enzyme
VPRSLGPPPLPGHENAAEHYFAAVYDRAVTTAGALAAAGGLIDPDALADELGQ